MRTAYPHQITVRIDLPEPRVGRLLRGAYEVAGEDFDARYSAGTRCLMLGFRSMERAEAFRVWLEAQGFYVAE